MQNKAFGIVIHGGAGVINRLKFTPELEQLYLKQLSESLNAGYTILQQGGSSLDATQASVEYMENSELFNAGKGSVFSTSGEIELDASIMDGNTISAGTVTCLKHVKNPIKLARIVMEKTTHVSMAGEGAEILAKQYDLEIVDQSYFFVQRRWDDLQKMLQKAQSDTVGAVALDQEGNLAAATSTGGRTGKLAGRISDSSVIGAGNYANNKTCAISCTGHGEYFMRLCLAYDVSAMIEYKNSTLEEAAEQAIFKKLSSLGGVGGLIGIDQKCNIVMPFNSKGMYRGYKLWNGNEKVSIFED